MGVEKYEVYVNGTLKKSVTDTITDINYMKCETTFFINVKAFDRMGNSSDESDTLELTTKTCPSTDSHNIQFRNNNLSIYPQPSSEMIRIESSDSEIEYIEIKNLAGITVFAAAVHSTSFTLGKEYVGPGLNVLTAIIDGKKVQRLLMFE